jgi:hypothetical protein
MHTLLLLSMAVEAEKFPGSTVITFIPNFLISILSTSVNPSCPYFVIQKAELHGIPIFPLLPVTFIIRPKSKLKEKNTYKNLINFLLLVVNGIISQDMQETYICACDCKNFNFCKKECFTIILIPIYTKYIL